MVAVSSCAWKQVDPCATRRPSSNDCQKGHVPSDAVLTHAQRHHHAFTWCHGQRRTWPGSHPGLGQKQSHACEQLLHNCCLNCLNSQEAGWKSTTTAFCGFSQHYETAFTDYAIAASHAARHELRSSPNMHTRQLRPRQPASQTWLISVLKAHIQWDLGTALVLLLHDDV